MNESIYQSEVDVLIAIDNVRKELEAASQRGATMVEMREIHSRLMSLYAALSIDNILVILEKVEHKKSA